MLNQVLWVLDNEMDATKFERLCIDLLYREGYRDIIPIGGTKDRGRDAQSLGAGSNKVIFFQFSLEKNWKKKLNDELLKARKNEHRIEMFVFVTSQKVTGASRDKFVAKAQNEFGWALIIYDREWLRLQLEEAFPDLAVKYLAISNSPPSHNVGTPHPVAPTEQSDEIAWSLFEEEKYEESIIEFKKLLQTYQNNLKAVQALAWSQYSLGHYQDALLTVNKALKIDDQNPRILSLKACILTEDGIVRGVKSNLIIAKSIFERIISSSQDSDDHYNLANVLSALGEWESAVQSYRKALELDNNRAHYWKNLGTAYHNLHNFEMELECYEKALHLDKNLPEALGSKGLTLIAIFDQSQEGTALIERALSIDERFALRWIDGWLWLSEGYMRQDNLEAALSSIDNGLSIAPHHSGLLQQKARILARLWETDHAFIEMALNFFNFYTEVQPENGRVVEELVRIHAHLDQKERAWEIFNGFLYRKNPDIESCAKQLGLDVITCAVSLRYRELYKSFRSLHPVTEYAMLFMDSSLDIPFDHHFLDELTLMLSIPYGVCCEIAQDTEKTDEEKVRSMVLMLQKALRRLLPRLILSLIDLLEPLDQSEGAITKITEVITLIPHIGLLELSRQVGFIGGRLSLQSSALEAAVTNSDLGKWQAEMSASTLTAINLKKKVS